jgi:hypothetical protein
MSTSTVVFGSGFRLPCEEAPGPLYVLVVERDSVNCEDRFVGVWHSTDRAALEAFALARRFEHYEVHESEGGPPAFHGDGRDVDIERLYGFTYTIKVRGRMCRLDGDEYIDRLVVDHELDTIGDLLALSPRDLRTWLGFGHDHLHFALDHGAEIVEALEDRVRAVMGELSSELDRRVDELFGAVRRPPPARHDCESEWDEEAA